jgi:hypothetical protein
MYMLSILLDLFEGKYVFIVECKINIFKDQTLLNLIKFLLIKLIHLLCKVIKELMESIFNKINSNTSIQLLNFFHKDYESLVQSLH